MTPEQAIATSDRPQLLTYAAGVVVHLGRVKCYESFTLNALWCGRSPRIFARVMTGRKPTSRTATRSAFVASAHMRRTNLHTMQFSAQNVLSLTFDF